jgi:hypothetical protein
MRSDTLYVVTVIATHRMGKMPKRWVHLQVRALTWTDAAVCQPVLDMEDRLVEEHDRENWWVEVRVYLANGDGAAEGLPVGREDGGACR